MVDTPSADAVAAPFPVKIRFIPADGAKIDRVQARRVIWRILVTYPLHRYRSFLRQPGRWLYVQWTDSNVDPQDARDEPQETSVT